MTTLHARKRSLDILRALSIFIVLFNHFEIPYGERILARIAWPLHIGSWIAVDIFFVLSGYLISGLLFKEHQKTGRIDFKRFFIRRGFKIYPAFWMLILITILFHLKPEVGIAGALPKELLFVQNYFTDDKYFWFPNWSLAVEEHFYILLPLGLILLCRMRKENPFKPLPLIFVWVAGGCLIMRILNVIAHPVINHTAHLRYTHLRIDSLFFGVLISYAFHYHREEYREIINKWGRFFILGPLLFIPAFCYSIYGTRGLGPTFIVTFGVILFFLGAGMILVWMVEREHLFGGGLWGPIAYIGSHSYSIYLWHAMVLTKTKFLAEKSYPIYWAVSASAAIGVGILASLIVEFPVLRLRDKLFVNKSSHITN